MGVFTRRGDCSWGREEGVGRLAFGIYLTFVCSFDQAAGQIEVYVMLVHVMYYVLGTVGQADG